MSDETQHQTQETPAHEAERELTDAELTGVDGAGILKPPSYDTPLDDGAGQLADGGFLRII